MNTMASLRTADGKRYSIVIIRYTGAQVILIQAEKTLITLTSAYRLHRTASLF